MDALMKICRIFINMILIWLNLIYCKSEFSNNLPFADSNVNSLDAFIRTSPILILGGK
jgi:hypothetical protein